MIILIKFICHRILQLRTENITGTLFYNLYMVHFDMKKTFFKSSTYNGRSLH